MSMWDFNQTTYPRAASALSLKIGDTWYLQPFRGSWVLLDAGFDFQARSGTGWLQSVMPPRSPTLDAQVEKIEKKEKIKHARTIETGKSVASPAGM
jgi:hypothetical protein